MCLDNTLHSDQFYLSLKARVLVGKEVPDRFFVPCYKYMVGLIYCQKDLFHDRGNTFTMPFMLLGWSCIVFMNGKV